MHNPELVSPLPVCAQLLKTSDAWTCVPWGPGLIRDNKKHLDGGHQNSLLMRSCAKSKHKESEKRECWGVESQKKKAWGTLRLYSSASEDYLIWSNQGNMLMIFCASFSECQMIYVSLSSLLRWYMSTASKMASSCHAVCHRQMEKGIKEHERCQKLFWFKTHWDFSRYQV